MQQLKESQLEENYCEVESEEWRASSWYTYSFSGDGWGTNARASPRFARRLKVQKGGRKGLRKKLEQKKRKRERKGDAREKGNEPERDGRGWMLRFRIPWWWRGGGWETGFQGVWDGRGGWKKGDMVVVVTVVFSLNGGRLIPTHARVDGRRVEPAWTSNQSEHRHAEKDTRQGTGARAHAVCCEIEADVTYLSVMTTGWTSKNCVAKIKMTEE